MHGTLIFALAFLFCVATTHLAASTSDAAGFSFSMLEPWRMGRLETGSLAPPRRRHSRPTAGCSRCAIPWPSMGEPCCAGSTIPYLAITGEGDVTHVHVCRSSKARSAATSCIIGRRMRASTAPNTARTSGKHPLCLLFCFESVKDPTLSIYLGFSALLFV